MTTWRSSPPTVDEVMRCEWWWYRTTDGGVTLGPSVMALNAVGDRIVTDGGVTFDPGDWGNEWAPCLPPDGAK